jgi:hypothetical protein
MAFADSASSLTGLPNPLPILLTNGSDSTDGGLLRLELFVSPQASGPPEYVHPRQEEHFEVISGIIRVRVDGREKSIGAG